MSPKSGKKDKISRSFFPTYIRFSWEDLLISIVGYAFIISIWPIAMLSWRPPGPRKELLKQAHSGLQMPFPVQVSDLIRKVEVWEIENREVIFDPLDAVPNLPFGHLNSRWRQLTQSAIDAEWWAYKGIHMESADGQVRTIPAGYVTKRGAVLGPELIISFCTDPLSAEMGLGANGTGGDEVR